RTTLAISGPDLTSRPRRFDQRLLALTAVVAIVLGGGVAVAVGRHGRSHDKAVATRPTSTTTSTTVTPTTVTTTPPAPPAALPPAQAKIIDDIKAQVSELRGLQWKSPLDVAVVTRDSFQKELRAVNARDQHL